MFMGLLAVVVVTDAVIKPVVIPVTSRGQGGSPPVRSAARRPLPLPNLPVSRAGGAVYGLAAVDGRGRVADRAVVLALGWAPGTRLDIRESGGLLIVRADVHGVFSVTGQGHLRLPAPVRHCCGLRSGDRVLLVAYPERDVVVVHPPAVLDGLLAACHAGLLGGDLG